MAEKIGSSLERDTEQAQLNREFAEIVNKISSSDDINYLREEILKILDREAKLKKLH